ncbi:MAG TPA: hypothetical protein VFA55_09150, partial [Candidatus Kapabacteria bacterium]|nr:hypothetical protein [Candidatus Kapabacteria bacterium]
DAEVEFSAIALEKQVLQEYVAYADQGVILSIVTSNSVEPTTGGITVTVLGETSGTIAYNASSASALAVLQAMPIHGKYFVSCFGTSLQPPNNLTITIDSQRLYNDLGFYNLILSGNVSNGNGGTFFVTPGSQAISVNSAGLDAGTPAVGGTDNVTELPILQPAFNSGITANYVPYFWWYYKQVNGVSTTFPMDGENRWCSFLDLMTAFLNLIETATDFSSSPAPAVVLDHLGVTARLPGAYPPVTTMQWGAGSGGSNFFDLANVIALRQDAFFNILSKTTPSYSLSTQGNCYDALKLACESVISLPIITFSESTGIVLTVKSPLSGLLLPLLSGNPEIVPIAGTLKQTPFAFQVDKVNCAIKKPTGYGDGGQLDDPGNPSANIVNPMFIAPNARNGTGVGAETMFATFWYDSYSSGNGQGTPVFFRENLLQIFNAASGATSVYSADFSMYDYYPGSGQPYGDSFTVNQGWGGGALTSGTAKTTTAAHWQQALAKGLSSLFCGTNTPTSPVGAEKIEFDTPLTINMLSTLMTTPLFNTVSVRTDTLHNYLVIGVKYNPFDIKRRVTITAIRNLND